MSIHSSDEDDPRGRRMEFMVSGAGRCMQAVFAGEVSFSADERDVTALGRGAMVYLRERTPRSDRELTITRGSGGSLEYDFSNDGRTAPFDAEAREWFASLLPEVIRETGIGAKERVARFRKLGGVPAVLAEVARTHSTGAKRAQYEALIDQGELSPDEMETIVRQAGRDLAGSDGDLSGVLAKLPRTARLSSAASASVGEAIGRITSDGDKRSVLQQYAFTGDRAMLLMAARQARTITSDGDKAGLLQTVAARYLTGDDSLRAAFFAVAHTIVSDGDKRSVLEAAIPYGHASEGVAGSVIREARSITSDGDKSEVLVAVVDQRLLTTKPLRDAFMEAARSITSDGDYRRVMEAALKP